MPSGISKRSRSSHRVFWDSLAEDMCEGSIGAAVADCGTLGVVGTLGSIGYIAYAKPDKLKW